MAVDPYPKGEGKECGGKGWMGAHTYHPLEENGPMDHAGAGMRDGALREVL
jgi:hypothetical protein